MVSSVVLLFSIATAQSQTCECDDPSSGASFSGVAFNTGECMGVCDNGRRAVVRRCQIPPFLIAICQIGTVKCTNPSSCQGSWSQFGSDGECDNSCGVGRRIQRRVCYIRDTNMRTTSCVGANGTNEQIQYIPCTSQSGCESTTTPQPTTTPTPTSHIVSTLTSISASPATDVTTKATLPTAATNASSMVTSHSQTSQMSIITRLTTIQTETTATTTTKSQIPPQGNSSDLTLPLVLCSVAVICVAVIVSFVIVFKRRPPSQINSALVSSSKDNNNGEKKKDSHNYETVGPALPPSRRPNSNHSLTVHNVLYTRDGNDGEGLVKSASIPNNLDDTEYLTPMRTRSTEVFMDDDIPRPKDFSSISAPTEEGGGNGLLLRENESKQANVNSVPNSVPKEGDYIKDISFLMKKKSPAKENCNKDLSDLSYVTIDQLKSRNLI